MAASVVAGVGAVFVAVGGSQQVWKMLKRHRNDQNAVERMHDENKNALADMIEISQVLSCIVEGVYKRCKDEKVPYTRSISEHWTHWGYEVVKFANLAGTYDVVDDDHWRAGDLGKSDDQCVRAVLFERSDSDQDPRPVLMRVEGTPDQLIPVGLPKYVLAIRGTIISCPDDRMSDRELFFERLHLSEGASVMRLLREITAKYKPHDIWVAGHSLGAAVALIATRSLAIDHDIVINPHLFNPPYFTVGRVISKSCRGVLKGVGDTFNIRAGTDKFDEIWTDSMSILSSMGRRIANSSYAENMENEAQKLVQIGYAPNLYVNPNDTICNDYIKHFQRRRHVNKSRFSAALSRAMSTKSVHMIPSAVLYINNWAQGFREAHRLLQWFRYRHVNLTVERQGLTGSS